MNRRWLITIFFTFLVTVFSVMQANAVMVGLNVLDDYIEVGESFDVEVWVDGEGINDILLSFGFDVITSDVFFTYTGYTLESGFLDFPDPDPNYVSGMAFPGISDDDILLATLSFSADAMGTDALGVNGLYDGLSYGLFYGSWPNQSGFDINATTTMTVNAVPVPEPATLLLLSVGLGVVGFVRRTLRQKEL